MKKKSNLGIRPLIAALTVALFMLACGSILTPTPATGQIETIVAGTMQAAAPPASATSQAATNPADVIATNTSAPLVTSLPPTLPAPGGTLIVFARGATQGIIEGTIQAGQTLTYCLNASKGQPLIAMVSSPNNDVTMSIVAQNGAVLLSPSEKSNRWQGALPGTQSYCFKLLGGASTESFTLSAIIAARIQFGAGQTSMTLNGTTVNGTIISYVAYALAGQTLEVSINTSPDDAGLTVWGFTDGQPYARAQNGVTEFSMELPSTQDYIIDVVPQGGRVINYTLTITIK